MNMFIEPNKKQPEVNDLHLTFRTENQLTEVARSESAKTEAKCEEVLISDIKKQVGENEFFMPAFSAIQEMAAWIASPDPRCPLDDKSQMKLRGVVVLTTVIESFRDIYNQRCQKPVRRKHAAKNIAGNSLVAVNSTPEVPLTVAEVSAMMKPIPTDTIPVKRLEPTVAPSVDHEKSAQETSPIVAHNELAA